MRRRKFLGILGAALAAPVAARAQEPGLRPARIGFLRASPPPDATLTALRRGLTEHGYAEGQRYVLVPSWGAGGLDRLPDLAAALVKQQVDLILTDGTQTARAARGATDTIPIVIAGGLDPVSAGLATSLSRPGGNVTGFTTQVIDVTSKSFEILSEMIQGLVRVTVAGPEGAGKAFHATEAAAARSLKLDLNYVYIVGTGTDAFESAFQQVVAGRAQAVILRGSPFFSTSQRKIIVERAATHRLPTIYETREFVELGGLVSYGTHFSELFRQAAGYIVRILKGAKAGDLPIEQANKFELVINLKAAKALGITVPPTLIARSDQVIE
jgi:putative ABC transport system substrate-binding protein